jgi:hypothetical protein
LGVVVIVDEIPLPFANVTDGQSRSGSGDSVSGRTKVTAGVVGTVWVIAAIGAAWQSIVAADAAARLRPGATHADLAISVVSLVVLGAASVRGSHLLMQVLEPTRHPTRWVTTWGPRTNKSPGFAVVMVVVGLSGSLLFGLGAIDGYTSWHRSEQILVHGAQTPVVVSGPSVTHHSRYGNYVTTPAHFVGSSGQDGETTVEAPADTDAPGVGTTIVVLVQSTDPGYSELPGRPAHTLAASAVSSLGGAVLLLSALGGVYSFRQTAARRRRLSRPYR